MASNTVYNQLFFYVLTSLLRELMLHDDFCLRAHLHVLVNVSVHVDLLSE